MSQVGGFERKPTTSKATRELGAGGLEALEKRNPTTLATHAPGLVEASGHMLPPWCAHLVVQEAGATPAAEAVLQAAHHLRQGAAGWPWSSDKTGPGYDALCGCASSPITMLLLAPSPCADTPPTCCSSLSSCCCTHCWCSRRRILRSVTVSLACPIRSACGAAGSGQPCHSWQPAQAWQAHSFRASRAAAAIHSVVQAAAWKPPRHNAGPAAGSHQLPLVVQVVVRLVIAAALRSLLITATAGKQSGCE